MSTTTNQPGRRVHNPRPLPDKGPRAKKTDRYLTQCKNCGAGIFANQGEPVWQTTAPIGLVHAPGDCR